jgi:hypothetical protein
MHGKARKAQANLSPAVVVERFTRISDRDLLYQAQVTDFSFTN